MTAFFFRPSGMEGTFLSPSCAKNPIECALGWLVMATFLALVVEEVLHVVAYGARYYKRSDAWIRLLVRRKNRLLTLGDVQSMSCL